MIIDLTQKVQEHTKRISVITIVLSMPQSDHNECVSEDMACTMIPLNTVFLFHCLILHTQKKGLTLCYYRKDRFWFPILYDNALPYHTFHNDL